jgi:hypothetical protein
MKSRFLLLLGLLIALAPGAFVRAQEAGAPPADTARVSISAVDQPLGSVLADLSRQIGRPILLKNGQDLKVRLSGQGIPFSAAMRLLARSYDLVAAWSNDTLVVATPKADLERLRATPTPEVIAAFGEIYGPLLRAGPGPYLDASQREVLVSTIEETLRAIVQPPADPALAQRLLEAVAGTQEQRLTRVVAEPVLNARIEAKDWKGATAIWRQAYPEGAPVETQVQGWRVAVGLAMAGDTAAAKTFVQEAKLQGDGWQPALGEVMATKPPVETVERVATAYKALLNGAPAVGAQANLGRDIIAALSRGGKTESAEQLWRTAILPAPVSAVTIDATLQVFQALLSAGGPKRAQPAWRDWYRWDRLKAEFMVDGKPATDNPRFALLKRIYGVALALGPAPPELVTFMRQVRFARPKTLRIAAMLDRRIQEDPAWREKTINRVEFASKKFEKHYNMKLEVVNFQFWVPRDETGPNGYVEQLKARKAKADADFVIGFVLHILPASVQAEAFGKHAQIVGYASPEFGGTMMLRDMAFISDRSVSFFAPELVNETSVHELGHAFGGLHTDDKTSVMRQGFGAAPAYDFDKFNQRVNIFFKEFDFDKGFECFDEGELRELAMAYQGLQGKCKQGNGAEEREAKLRFILARRLRVQNRKEEAITQYTRVVRIGEPKNLVKQAKAELVKLQSGAPARPASTKPAPGRRASKER